MTEGRINRAAVFSDCTENFITPAKPQKYDKVTVRCRVARDDVEKIIAVVNGIPRPMKKESQTEFFDIYAVDIPLGKDRTDYFFEIIKEDETVFYNKQGVVDGVNHYFNFVIIPGYDTPDWAKGAVMYQIFVDRFYNGDMSNDVVDNEYTYIEEQHVSREGLEQNAGLHGGEGVLRRRFEGRLAEAGLSAGSGRGGHIPEPDFCVALQPQIRYAGLRLY